MKAFWWFKENRVAGMARPGFNGVRWFDLPFEEAIVFGWLGQRSSGLYQLRELRQHIHEYGTKIIGFHGVNATSFQSVLERLAETSRILEVLERIAAQTKCIDFFEIADQKIAFKLSRERLAFETAFLKDQGIQTIVTLTENHNQKEELSPHFELHHLAVDDLQAPKLEQALYLADIIRAAQADQRKIVAHCMAGVGRTSTLLMAAHLLLGADLEDLKTLVAKQNPSFKFIGPQAAFLESVARNRA